MGHCARCKCLLLYPYHSARLPCKPFVRVPLFYLLLTEASHDCVSNYMSRFRLQIAVWTAYRHSDCRLRFRLQPHHAPSVEPLYTQHKRLDSPLSNRLPSSPYRHTLTHNFSYHCKPQSYNTLIISTRLLAHLFVKSILLYSYLDILAQSLLHWCAAAPWIQLTSVTLTTRLTR